jgi:hypothetical protein
VVAGSGREVLGDCLAENGEDIGGWGGGVCHGQIGAGLGDGGRSGGVVQGEFGVGLGVGKRTGVGVIG